MGDRSEGKGGRGRDIRWKRERERLNFSYGHRKRIDLAYNSRLFHGDSSTLQAVSRQYPRDRCNIKEGDAARRLCLYST